MNYQTKAGIISGLSTAAIVGSLWYFREPVMEWLDERGEAGNREYMQKLTAYMVNKREIIRQREE